jgi:hypothetical protein
MFHFIRIVAIVAICELWGVRQARRNRSRNVYRKNEDNIARYDPNLSERRHLIGSDP